jgi:toxin ParE1/3/4
LRVFRTPKFIDEVSDAYAYLAVESPRSAERMFDALEALIALLAAFPEMGRRRDDLERGDVRSCLLRRFRLIVFYPRIGEEIVLLRLLHGARDIQGGDL